MPLPPAPHPAHRPPHRTGRTGRTTHTTGTARSRTRPLPRKSRTHVATYRRGPAHHHIVPTGHPSPQ